MVYQAVGRLVANETGRILGTAFAFTPLLAITAQHCIAPEAQPVRLVFPSGLSIQVAPIRQDDSIDVAILSLEEALPSDYAPVQISDEVDRFDEFAALGFAAALEAMVDGFTITGKVANANAYQRGMLAALQLQCQEASARQAISLHGLSGAPVLVHELAVGVVRWNPESDQDESELALGGTLYACPTREILRVWPDLQEMVLRPGLERKNRIVQSLLDTPLGEDRRLMRVRDADPYSLGVTPSSYARPGGADPYVPRSADEDIRVAIRNSSMVVVQGASKAGKSRSAFEACLTEVPDAALVVPKSGSNALRQIFIDSVVPLPPGTDTIVVWLDGLDRFITPAAELTSDLFDSFDEIAPRVIVVATITATRLRELRNAAQIDRVVDRILHRAEVLNLAESLSDAELPAAKELYPTERFNEGDGIGEKLIAAVRLMEKYLAIDENRHGWAVVQACVDWARIGMLRPILQRDIERLLPTYLGRISPQRQDVDPAAFKEALSWATEPVTARIALLNRSNDLPGAYEAFEYIVDVSESSSDPQIKSLPLATWRFCLSRANPVELLNIGLRAVGRGETDQGELALRFAIESRDWYLMPQAQFVLAYVRTVNSGDSTYAGAAALSLGSMLLEQGELADAEEWLTRATELTEGDMKAFAWVRLASICERRGRPADAISLYQRALTSEAGIRQLAAVQIGNLAFAVDDMATAERYLRIAVGLGADLDYSAYEIAMCKLAEVLREQGNLDEAEQKWREVIQSDRCSEEGRALSVPGLVDLLRSQGRDREAEEVDSLGPGAAQYNEHMVSLLGGPEFVQMAEQEARFGDSLWAGAATEFLLQRAQESDDVDLARRLFSMAKDQGKPLLHARSSITLGTMLLQRDMTDEAYLLLADVANGELAYEAAKASLLLGAFHLSEGPDGGILGEGPDAGIDALVGVFSGDNDGLASAAAIALGEYYLAQGSAKSAILWLKRGIERGSDEIKASASLKLGRAHYELGDAGAAKGAWEVAAAIGDKDSKAQAYWLLGCLRLEADELGEAETLWKSLLELSLPRWNVLAAQALVNVWERIGREENSMVLLTQLADNHVGQADGPAFVVLLARLLHERDETSDGLQRLTAALPGADLEGRCTLLSEIAEIKLQSGDEPGALDAWRQLLQGGLPSFSGQAAIALAQYDTSADAEALLRAAIETGDVSAAAEGSYQLGRLLSGDGRVDEAAALLRQVLQSDDPYLRPMAMIELGRLSEDPADAEQYFLAAVNEQHPVASRQAAAVLGASLLDQGRDAEALPLFLIAAEYKDARVAGYARTCAAGLLFEQGERDRAWDIWRATSAPEAYGVAYVRTVAALASDLSEAEGAEARPYLIKAAQAVDGKTRKAELLSLMRGLVAVGESPRARLMLQRLLGGDEERDAEALLRGLLAEVLQAEGDTSGAAEEYRKAMALNQFGSATAAIALGALLEQQGDLAAARDAYAGAVSLETPEAALVLVSLGMVSERLGDLQAAEAAYRRALESDISPVPSEAAWRLALLLESQGDPVAAREVWEQVAEHGSEGQADLACFQVGLGYFRERNYEVAAEWWARVAHTQGEVGQQAAFMLGNLRAEFGAPWPEVRDLLLNALNGPDAYIATRAGLLLYRRLYEDGDRSGAVEALTVVLSVGDESSRGEALVKLGEMAAADGDTAGAERKFQDAVELGEPSWASAALQDLASLCEQGGDPHGAIDALERAAQIPDADSTSAVLNRLGALYETVGDSEAAVQAWRALLDSGEPADAARAAVRLGRILFSQGDREGAQALWRQAMESDDEDSVALARESLRLLIDE